MPAEPVRLDSIERALVDIAAGKPVVVIDDEDRENEGDLIIAGSLVTPESIAFMVRHTSGFLCVAMPESEADRLDLPPMRAMNQDARGTAYTVTVDARAGGTTGISAADRAHTIQVLADPTTGPDDLSRPGHVVPLRARPGGVLRRAGHTEAAVDLTRLAGLAPVGVLCEIVSALDPTGMARAAELRWFADRHDLCLVSIADLIAYRRRTQTVVERVASTRLPLAQGEFQAIGYRSPDDGREHIALVFGDLGDGTDVLTRVHAECLIGDVFGSQRCACGRRLEAALAAVATRGRGVVVYIRGDQVEGMGLLGELRAYQLQDETGDVESNPTPEADRREYGVGAQILVDLGVRSVELLTSETEKRAGLVGHGLRIPGQLRIDAAPAAGYRPSAVLDIGALQRELCAAAG